MRILGFSKKWGKLNQLEFTTFRFPRKDKDWWVGETVSIVYKPRSPTGEALGIAEIISKAPKVVYENGIYGQGITEAEAKADGFLGWDDMVEWIHKTYAESSRWCYEPINKLTLRWLPEAAEPKERK